ncbi:hypothetical protein BG261_00185 [Floricoccus tropicus]|uniref:DUF2975 domain-containing protein n=1 Tax=Floricoccus tropicus TaxID=1859473 RepID=A0A1E8GQ08_9LACT|nr:DUF2975 domain-containing protein [Floricoccus tropicus]OFI50340.1 hypothetical protein BG261_00185 [Floricoccus tropicus]
MKFKNFALKLAIIFLEVILTSIVFIIGISSLNEGKLEFSFPIVMFWITILGSLFISYFVAFKLNNILKLIEKNKAFSVQTIETVRSIKKAVMILVILSFGILPIVYMIADLSDGPGFMIFGFLFVLLTITMYVFTLIVEELFTSAFNIQNENNLTI